MRTMCLANITLSWLTLAGEEEVVKWGNTTKYVLVLNGSFCTFVPFTPQTTCTVVS